MVLFFTLSGAHGLRLEGDGESKRRQRIAGANIATGHADDFRQFLECPFESGDVARIAGTGFNLDGVVGFAINALKVDGGWALLIGEG